MSSGPRTLFDALTVADGYLDEAFNFELTREEIEEIVAARDAIQRVIERIATNRGDR